MWTRIAVWLCALAIGSLASAQEGLPDPAGMDGEAAFFAAIDLREAGDCEGAIARFELALARDPSLLQSHLYIAECCLSLGLEERAVAEVVRYLEAGDLAVETDRARQVLQDAGEDPEEYLPEGRTAPSTASWSRLRVEIGGGVGTFDNAVGLTVGGPSLGLRVLPWRYLELAVRGRLGLGPYPDREGTVRVPEVHAGLAASIPLGRARIVAGPLAAWVVSQYSGETRVDGGILGELGVRLSPPRTRLVIGVSFLGGWLVAPTVGGEVTLGLQLGRRGN